MWRKGLLVLLFGVVLLVVLPLTLVVRREYASSRRLREGGRVLRLPGEDCGYPSPFQFYPRGPGYVHMSMIFDTLTWKDKQGVIGLLAQSWEVSSDRKKYTFTLRPNVSWHDGARLTARDVAFSVKYLKQHTFKWDALRMIKDAIPLDDQRVVIELAEPFAPFLVNAAGSFPIIPAHIWEKVQDPEKFSGKEALIGSGPFKLESYSKAHGTYSYVANENYFLGPPIIKKLQYVAVGDTVLALKKGEIDAMRLWGRTVDAVSEFRQQPGFKIIQGPSEWVLRLVFNHNHPALSHREIRQAFAHAIDLNDIAQRLRHGHVEMGCPAILPSASPWRNPDIPEYTFDLDRARFLVEASGLEHLSFTLLTTPEYVREADYISSQADKVGISVQVKSLPASTRDALLREGKFELAIDGYGGIGGDPDVLRKHFCVPGPDGAQKGRRGGAKLNPRRTHGYLNRELNRLGREQVQEGDEEKRRALVYRMQEVIARDVPTIALWYSRVYFVYDHEALDGWFYTPGGIGSGVPFVQNKLVYIDRSRW